MMIVPLDQLQMQGIDPLLDRQFVVRKRDGRLEEFNEARIFLAIESAFKARLGLAREAPLPDSAHAALKTCADKVVEQVMARAVRGEELEVERIQDAVENQLMLGGHLEVLRCFILYRDLRRRNRMEREAQADGTAAGKSTLATASAGSSHGAAPTARLKSIYAQALPKARAGENTEALARRHFDCYLNEGEYLRCLTTDLLDFESAPLARGLHWERDARLSPGALEMLYERFLAHEDGRRFETPQYFWMRIAMGLALPEQDDIERRALGFYEVLSALRFIPSETILANAGKPRPVLMDSPDGTTREGHRLEIWHRNVLDLLKPSIESTKSLWIPDLFMRRLQQKGQWTLLDPAEATDLERCHGALFETRYHDHEQKAVLGRNGFAAQRPALDLWKGVLKSTANGNKVGIVFADAVPHCDELDGDDEEAGPGLARPGGAVNLAAHVREGGLGLDLELLGETITEAVRMLDNAIDVTSAGCARHRPIGLGAVGFAETLARLNLTPGTSAAADFADWTAEFISHSAILASSRLARERGCFPEFGRSRWSHGILPMDALALLLKERGLSATAGRAPSQDWGLIREMLGAHGLRNGMIHSGDTFATAAMIAGVVPETEPTDPALSIECAARRAKWSEADQTVALQMTHGAGAPGQILQQAWERGIGRVLACPPAREAGAKRSESTMSAATARAEMASAN